MGYRCLILRSPRNHREYNWRCPSSLAACIPCQKNRTRIVNRWRLRVLAMGFHLKTANQMGADFSGSFSPIFTPVGEKLEHRTEKLVVGSDPTMRSGFRIIRCVNKKMEHRTEKLVVGRDPTMRSGFRIIRCVNKKIERRDDSIGTSGALKIVIYAGSAS